ncbi:MAG: biotin-dependent carboxyltransferase family protein [Acidobacteriota bacterium]
MPSVTVVAPGLLTTVQDRGRWGWQAHGVPVAGPMDPWAHRLANALVGNVPDSAALEITYEGPDVRFDDARWVAVTGADFDVTVDGCPVPAETPAAVAPGSVLRFGALHRGARAYLAIAGGITVPPVLGSRSTHMDSRMGGLEGRALRAGDCLPLGDVPTVQAPRGRGVAPSGRQRATGATAWATLRVIAGPEPARFESGVLAALESSTYRVESSSNRMGLRLAGPRLSVLDPADRLSEATPMGTLQVPASGQPILLMADRPTTGGYPVLATVASADIGVAAQLRPGDAVRFVPVSLEEALAALIAIERPLMRLAPGAMR